MKIFLKDCSCCCLVLNERKKEKRQSKTQNRKKDQRINAGMELTIFLGKENRGEIIPFLKDFGEKKKPLLCLLKFPSSSHCQC